MPKTSITMITKDSTYLFSFMVVIDHFMRLRSKVYTTYNTCCRRSYKFLQAGIRNYVSKPTTSYFISVRTTAVATPTIKPTRCFVVERKIIRIQRFKSFAPSAIFYLQFHTRKLFRKRELGSLAAFGNFLAIPPILAQKLSRRGPPSGWGALSPGFPGLALL